MLKRRENGRDDIDTVLSRTGSAAAITALAELASAMHEVGGGGGEA